MSYLNKRPEYQNDRPSKGKIFVRRLKRFLKPFFFLMLIFGLIIGGGWIFYRVAGDQQFSFIREKIANALPMKIDNIIITGCKLTSEDDVKKALNVKKGDSILNLSVSDAQERLNNLTFVDHATIKRQLPNTIIVQIIEREPFAVWQHQGKFMLIGRDGHIVNDHQGQISRKDAEAFLKLPLVVGVGANVAAAELLDILSNYPDVKNRIVAAVRTGDRRWNLNLKNGIVVLLPENQELPAIQRLVQLQKEIQLLDRPIKDIDLRLPDRLIIRKNKEIIPPPTPNDNASSDITTIPNNP